MFIHVYSTLSMLGVLPNYDNVLFVVIAATKDFTPPAEVCSGETTTSSCSRDSDVLEWSIGVMRIALLTYRSDASMVFMEDGINFTVTLIFLNTSLTISNISFTATLAADGKVLSCTGGGISEPATICVVSDGKPLLRYEVTVLSITSQKDLPPC